MKTIIAGSRNVTDYDVVKCGMKKVSWEITEVVSGGAKGIDTLGERWANEHGLPLKVFAADWNEYGRAAGPIRNAQMTKYADALVAFNLHNSRGTLDMIRQARKANIKALVIDVATYIAAREAMS